MLFIGLDIGTQGARCVAADEKGRVAASASKSFAKLNCATQAGWREQNPRDWWGAAREVLRAVCAQVPANEIRAVTIDGTSGTVVPLDAENRPIGNALMYDDARSRPQAVLLQESKVADAHQALHGYRIGASFALPKIRWCIDQGMQAVRYANQADYIVGLLTGEYGVTDYANALKMGYDLVNLRWDDYITAFGVDKQMLPRVIACGEVIAPVTAAASLETGLPTGTPVCAGATDSYASSLAAGLAGPGDWASVLGTTLALKGITENILLDKTGSVYCHKHPQGWWMPGGASNAGGRYLNENFGKDRFAELNQKAQGVSLPTGGLCYPTTGIGERFPFDAPSMKPFRQVSGREEAHYVAAMEGVGYVERMAYENLEKMGATVGQRIFTAGGGCRSELWLSIRATILNRQLQVPRYMDAAVGCAMLAAANMHYSNLREAVANMCEIVQTVDPIPGLKAQYDEVYAAFCAQCAEAAK